MQELNAGGSSFANEFKRGGNDLRPLWATYLSSVNFLTCPLVPTLDRDLEAIPATDPDRIYMDYYQAPGYWHGNDLPLPTNVWQASAMTSPPPAGEAWTTADEQWEADGRRFEVLAGDRMELRGTFGGAWIDVNHPDGFDGANEQVNANPSSFWSTLYRVPTVPANQPATYAPAYGNAVKRDGSTAGYSGDDPKLAQLRLVNTGGPRMLVPSEY